MTFNGVAALEQPILFPFPASALLPHIYTPNNFITDTRCKRKDYFGPRLFYLIITAVDIIYFNSFISICVK